MRGRQGDRSGSRTLERALVLRRFPYGESSLVVHVLCPAQGRVSLLAKGAYRPTSGYCGVLDLFDTLELGWSTRREGGLALLTRGAVLQRRTAVVFQAQRYRAGLAALELVELVARELHPEPALFALLASTLDILDAGMLEPRLSLLAFDLKLLAELGLAPALERCAACGVAEAPRSRSTCVPFAPAAGGRMCSSCAAQAGAAGRPVASVPLHALRIARSLMDASPASLERTRLRPAALAAVTSVVQRFLEYHLESRPRAHTSALADPRTSPG